MLENLPIIAMLLAIISFPIMNFICIHDCADMISIIIGRYVATGRNDQCVITVIGSGLFCVNYAGKIFSIHSNRDNYSYSRKNEALSTNTADIKY